MVMANKYSWRTPWAWKTHDRLVRSVSSHTFTEEHKPPHRTEERHSGYRPGSLTAPHVSVTFNCGMWKYSFKMINNVKRASNQRHTSDYISTQTGLHTAKWGETGQMESLQRHSPEPWSLIHLAASPMFMLGNILGPFVQLLVHDIHFSYTLDS